jgi:ABC-type branched-subunit amino acid transport system substrate-binding protein
MGEAVQRGIELFQKDNPSEDVEFVFEDHKYDAKTAITALHIIRNVGGAELIVVWGNTPASACAPIAQQQKFPMIAASMNPDARKRSFVVTLGAPVSKVVEKIYEQFVTWSIRKPAAVSVDIGNALQALEILNKKLAGILSTKVVSSDEIDFKSIILGLKAKGVDGVVLFLIPQQAMTFLRQAKQMNYLPKIVGGDVFADETFQREAAALTNSFVFIYGSVPKPFMQRVQKLFGSLSYFYETAVGYSLASLASSVVHLDKSNSKVQGVIDRLSKLELSSLPLGNPIFLDTPEEGRHIEVDAGIYSLPVNSE